MTERGPEIESIIRETFLEITKRMAGTEPRPLLAEPPSYEPFTWLFAAADGDYRLELALRAEDEFLINVASKMKRAPLGGEEEMVDYIKEYFNIVCGRIVSAINRKFARSARIGLTQCGKSGALPGMSEGEPLCGGSYESDYGCAVLQGVYRDTRTAR